MFDKTTILVATAASFALLSSVSAELSPELKARKLPDCIPSHKFNDIEDKSKFWSESGAEQFADDYINSRTDHSQWAQNLYRDLFEDKVHSMFDCESPDASCVITAECSDFNEAGKGGLYYLYTSLVNYHSYMKALRTEMNIAFIQNSLSVATIQEILQLPDGKSDTPINIFSILSTGASAAGAIPGNAAWAAATTAFSAVFSIAGELAPTPEAIDMTGKAEAAITKLISDSVEQTNDIIADLVGAVFGRQGQSQDIIPENMRRGAVSNPAVSVLGWGDWLRDDGNTVAARSLVKSMKTKADQSLLWQMARLFKRTYVLVRPDLKESDCTDAVNAWDPDYSRCYTLHSWNGQVNGLQGGANDLSDMWTRWNMSPLYTMRNAVQCWEANDGKIGDVKITQSWTSSEPPPCFFAMTVLKGSYESRAHGGLWLTGDFAGQKGLEGKYWPQNKCKAWGMSKLCEYEWSD